MTPRLVPPWHVLVENRQRRACPRHVRFVALHVRNDGASRGFCQSVLGHDPGPPARNRWSELVAMICLVGQSWRFLQAAPDGPDQPEFAAQKRHERSRRFGGRPARSLNHESSTRCRPHRRVSEWRQLSSFRVFDHHRKLALQHHYQAVTRSVTVWCAAVPVLRE